MEKLLIDGTSLDFESLIKVVRRQCEVALDPVALQRVVRAREFAETLVKEEKIAYGVTTGFGKFSEVLISPAETAQLQYNLIRSHACGVGEPFDIETVRAILLLRANTLARGHSGIAPGTLELLLQMLNQGVHPVIPQQGSVGASGDLCPLAHLVLVMLGEGEAFYQDRRLPGGEALRLAGLTPACLGPKEGLALINGTQMMNAVGALTLMNVKTLAKTADIAAALSLEALRGTDAGYDARVQQLRPYPGQQAVASNLKRLIEGSQIRRSHLNCGKVQDAYSLRCVPQVHGAGRDALAYVENVLQIEMNSVTDNPLLFPEDGAVISGGNFHGQPLALALDFLAIATAEWANISERRIERLENSALSGLPPFLTARGGLNSGMMIAQYTAAALVSENKVLAHPASVDSIPTSANQEDHVSMGSIAARKAGQIANNLAHVLAIEVMAAAQGIDFLKPLEPGRGTAVAYNTIRERVPRLDQDRVLYPDIESLTELIVSGRLLEKVEEAIGKLE